MLFLISATPTTADAGWVTGSGNPRLMKDEHETIAMKSEVVNITVRKKLISVECTFNFENSGPACSVKMGFPDVPLDAGDDKIYPMFFSYKSYVDGQEAPTKCEEDKEDSVFWHTQIVDFPARSTVSIKDIYTLPAGFSPTSKEGARRAFFYFLSTGASWKGPIESAVINVTFAPDVAQKPLVVLGPRDKDSQNIASNNKVKYEASTVPTIKANRLTFTYTNIEPIHNDDLAFEFGKELSEKQAISLYLKVIDDFIHNQHGTFPESELQELRRNFLEVSKPVK